MHFSDSLFPPFFLSSEEMGPLMEKGGTANVNHFPPQKRKKIEIEIFIQTKKAYNNITCTQIRRSKKSHNSMIKGKE